MAGRLWPNNAETRPASICFGSEIEVPGRGAVYEQGVVETGIRTRAAIDIRLLAPP